MDLPLTPTRFLDRSAYLYGQDEALVCGDVRLTYAEYRDRVRRLSHALRDRLGIGPGDRVLYLGMNCHRLLELYYAVLPIGAVLVPVNIRLSPQDVGFIVGDSSPRALFVSPELLPMVSRLPILPEVSRVLVYPPYDNATPPDFLPYEDLLAEASAEPIEFQGLETDMAEIFYTSGTTARPRGVMLSHRSLYLHAMSVLVALGITDRDRMVVGTVPLFHVNAWGTPQFMVAAGGLQIVVPRFDPELFAGAVERERANLAIMVPTMLNAFLNHPARSGHDVTSLRRLVLGGAPPVSELVRRVREEIGVECLVGYGLTETCPVVSVATLKRSLADEPPDEKLRRTMLTGMPVVGTEVRVTRDDGSEVEHDGRETGEILVRGDQVMDGYWNRPEETAQALSGGWLHTGDLATVDAEGYLNVVDRKKDIVISGGENISSVEVEEALYRNPAVLEAAVVANPDPVWGEIPVAMVVLRPGIETSAQAIIEEARAHLAAFKVPREVVFLDELPKTATGKIMKAELRRRLGERSSNRTA